MRHRDTETPRHRDTETPRHRDTETPRHRVGFINLFLILLFQLYSYSISAQILCEGIAVPPNRVIQKDFFISDLRIGFFSNKPEVYNICGDENGYYMIIEHYNNSDQNVNLNFEIDVNPQKVNVYPTSNSGFSSFNNSDIKGIISTTVKPFEFYCARINFAIPEQNIYNGDWSAQRLQILVKNLNTNATFDQLSNYFAQNFTGATFVLYQHHLADVYTSSPVFSQIGNNYFHKNFIVDTNFDFVSNSTTPTRNYFALGSKTLINSGKILDISDTENGACLNRKWDGIVADIGAFITADRMEIFNASTGVTLNDQGEIALDNSLIHDSDVGMLINNRPTIESFNNNKFENLQIGIHLNNSRDIKLTPSDISKPNLFKNISDKGIFSWVSKNTECMFNNFENIGNLTNTTANQGAIVSTGSSMTIAKNEFKNSSLGVSSSSDKPFYVQENTFDNNNLGIALWKNNDVFSAGKNDITGPQGIRFINAYPHIDDNYISSSGSFATAMSFGIEGRFSNHATIRDNEIFSSNGEAGINLFNVNNNLIWSNDIGLMSQNEIAGIKLNGGISGSVQSNTIDASSSTPGQSIGIFTSNTSADIICNDISHLEEAIVARDNTLGLDLVTNGMFAVNTGIELEHSIIGEQKHYGNLFNGPAFSTADLYAINMTTDEIQGSQFLIDRAENGNLWPDNVACFGNIAIDDPTSAITQSCNSVVYTTRPKDRLLNLCSIITALKNNPAIDPVRKKNLLAFYFKLINKYFPDKTKWPACLTQLLSPVVIVNIEKMVKTTDKIDLLLSPPSISTNTLDSYNSSLSNYITALRNNSNVTQARQDFVSQQSNLELSIPDRTTEQQTLVQEIEIDLNLFVPSDVYETAWLDVHKAWLKNYKGEAFNSSDKSTLLSIAAECPLLYGEVVYAARALVRDWDNTRYDLIDCNDATPRTKIQFTTSNSIIYPNPTSSILNVDFNGGIAEVIIATLDGKNVLVRNIVKGESIEVNSLKNGMYLIKIKNEKGEVSSEKFLKVE